MSASGKKIVAALLLLLGVAMIAGGVVYATTTASKVPSFMPGKSKYYERQHKKELKSVAKQGFTVKNDKVYSGDKLATNCTFNKDCRLVADRKLTKRGLGLIVLGALSFVGAWYVSGMRKPTEDGAAAAATS